MKKLLILAMLLWPAVVSAQPAPTVVTTLRTTDTSTTSIKVGCTLSGSCTGGILSGPIDVASVTSAGFIGIANNVPGATSMRLYNNAGTLTWNGVALATGASVSGTINLIPVFTGASTLGNSIMTQSGTTITVANTIAATTGTFTNVGGTLSTATQNSVTTMTALASVGTITSGVWTGTLIDLTRGGTGANLSGTGGTSQFLRQNTVGGAITVVRPAISDLSDASNVALLNAANTFTATPNTFTGGSASSVGIMITNTTSGVGAFTRQTMTAGTMTAFWDTFSQGFTTSDSAIQSGTRLFTAGAGGISLAATGGAIGFRTGADLLRWGINAAGDHTFGASSHIADSNGTPSVSACGTSPSIAGTDYAFTVQAGSGATTSCFVTFGHVFTAVSCVASAQTNANAIGVVPGTTSVSFNYASASSLIINVLCRGY